MLTRLLLLTLALSGFIFYATCTSQSDQTPAPFAGSLGSSEEYFGPETLEERLARADVIVRAQLVSATPASQKMSDPTHYISVVELRFRALEYLRGSGATQLVAVIDDDGIWHDNSGRALAGAKTIEGSRDTQWDGREAILFLQDRLEGPKQADRYWLGAVRTYPVNTADDGYSVASRYSKRWLPAASAGGAAGQSGSDGQRFLLDAPQPAATAEGGSGQAAPSAPTITLGDMKAKIAAMEREVTAGGGAAYKECLYWKYEWAREASYMKKHYTSWFKPGRNYFYIRHDATIGSGLAAETRAFTDPNRAALNIHDNEPALSGDFPIMGRDAGLFTTKWPGVADTMRPLPAGEYKLYYGYRPKKYIVCDGMPEEEKKREELFVTVTAPAGTVHEAFFDPVTIGSGVGADGTNGVLKPTGFSVGGTSTAITGLKWENGAVVLTLSPYVALTGRTLDFIALDGAVSLALPVSSATADATAGTLTWTRSAQPWQNGDKLMLRIRASDGSTSSP